MTPPPEPKRWTAGDLPYVAFVGVLTAAAFAFAWLVKSLLLALAGGAAAALGALLLVAAAPVRPRRGRLAAKERGSTPYEAKSGFDEKAGGVQYETRYDPTTRLTLGGQTYVLPYDADFHETVQVGDEVTVWVSVAGSASFALSRPPPPGDVRDGLQ
ncbi:hypothetical protein EPO15_18580 [bacterium]|nr:MAG: hypothetical protein EPO15_18580 [bacterium]